MPGLINRVPLFGYKILRKEMKKNNVNNVHPRLVLDEPLNKT